MIVLYIQKNNHIRMGIRHLNKYFIQKCKKDCIQKMALSDLSGKTIVIDTSIYLYTNLLGKTVFRKVFST